VIGRIVEIANDDRHLACERGFLVVRSKEEEVGRVPLDDIAALIGNAHGLSYSNNLLVALAERGCPFVLCGPQHRPVGILWALEGHYRQAARMDAQLAAPLPLQKQLWRRLVQDKLRSQADVLAFLERPDAPLRALIRKVKSGDPSNAEAQGAKAYWRLLLGKEFRRDPESGGLNGLLNYGYAVLRAIVARHAIATGLHPGIPIHHRNEGNSLRLIDDLMEPFRPLVDLCVVDLMTQGVEEVGPVAKKVLGQLHARTLRIPQRSPVTMVVQRYLGAFADACAMRSADEFDVPRSPNFLRDFRCTDERESEAQAS